MIPFVDRADAGRRLAPAVADLGLHDPVVLGLPRGGVPVAAEVAAHLAAPLDVLVVRKVGAPRNPEFALGAIGEGGVEVLDTGPMARLGLRRRHLQDTLDRERDELRRRVTRYRGERAPVDPTGRDVVIVDDGLATGNTALAAIEVVRARGPRRVVVAVPVGAADSVHRLRARADAVVCLHAPAGFRAVGSWYDDFEQVADSEVERLLAAART